MNNHLVSFVVLTRNRADEAIEALKSIRAQSYPNKEIVVVDNASTDNSPKLIKEHFPDVRLLRMEVNTGVGGGRNIGIQASRGEIIIFIDDDAYLWDSGSTGIIVDRLLKEKDLALIAFKAIDPFIGVVDRRMIPRRDKRVIEEEYECSYFAGVGFAIKRGIIEEVGLFPEDYLYAGEDLDLSLRIIQAGFKIIYMPEIVVYHTYSARGRTSWQEVYYQTRNRPWIAFKYLPSGYAIVHSLLWWLKGLIDSLRIGALNYYLKGLRDSIKNLPAIVRGRKVVSPETIMRLKSLSGRLYY